MTSQSPRIYLYKITFEEVPYYYYGIHKEKKFNEYYMGSPVTHKWCWELYTPKKQILELFEYSDEGWEKALEIEERVIRPFYNDDEWCLNERCGCKFSLDVLIKTGKKMYELGIGMFAMSAEEWSEAGRKGGTRGGNRNKENKTGFCGRTKEQMSKDGKKGTEIARKLGVGLYGLTKEQRIENGKKFGKLAAQKSNSQRWMCLETGYVSNSGALAHYQRARGIDTSKRVRVS